MHAQDHRIQAAVLLPLFCGADIWQVLFTRRSEKVQDHKGQVSFPGGAFEDMDMDLDATALREAQEEIGLDQDNVLILGRMRAMPTVSNYQVTPVVGLIKKWPASLKISDDEVARVFSIPVHWLVEKMNYEIKPYLLSNGNTEKVYFYHPYDGETLWGITARITQDFLKMIEVI